MADARAYYAQCEPRGEFVLVVEGAAEETAEERPIDAAMARVRQLREEGTSLKEASAAAAKEFGLRRRELYDLAIGKGGADAGE